MDAQLLISAQTTSRYANALYAAAALDLPRRGVVHLEGGMGAIAQALVQAIREHGGERALAPGGHPHRHPRGATGGCTHERGEDFDADIVVANLTPWNLHQLLVQEPSAPQLHPRSSQRTPGAHSWFTWASTAP